MIELADSFDPCGAYGLGGSNSGRVEDMRWFAPVHGFLRDKGMVSKIVKAGMLELLEEVCRSGYDVMSGAETGRLEAYARGLFAVCGAGEERKQIVRAVLGAVGDNFEARAGGVVVVGGQAEGEDVVMDGLGWRALKLVKHASAWCKLAKEEGAEGAEAAERLRKAAAGVGGKLEGRAAAKLGDVVS
jgi:hypothetical protein